jgi:hypothetical protein
MLQSITQNVELQLIFWNILSKGNLNKQVEGTKLDLPGSLQSPTLKRLGEYLNYSALFM